MLSMTRTRWHALAASGHHKTTELGFVTCYLRSARQLGIDKCRRIRILASLAVWARLLRRRKLPFRPCSEKSLTDGPRRGYIFPVRVKKLISQVGEFPAAVFLKMVHLDQVIRGNRRRPTSVGLSPCCRTVARRRSRDSVRVDVHILAVAINLYIKANCGLVPQCLDDLTDSSRGRDASCSSVGES